jgi:hypothetical protein
MKRAFTLSTLCVFLFLLNACVSQTQFDRLYNHYFPKRTEYVQGIYRSAYDRFVFRASAPPARFDSDRINHLFYAVRGDADAAHRFFHHRDRDTAGEPSESWSYDCVLLLIRLGDEPFSKLLAREDRQTRKAIGYAIDPQIDWSIHRFPKTRALYSYRYKRNAA